MGFSASLYLLPVHTKHHPSSSDLKGNPSFFLVRRRSTARKNRSIVPVARLFGPAIFESSKLRVLFVGVDEEKHPGTLPRTYTLTHSDITSKLMLAISNTVHHPQLQGWYNQLQRDEVVAEWKKVKGKMSLHVHCHISGGHFLHDLIANLRYYIFRKELPVVLNAFVHGDVRLFNTYPELVEAPVWVYFQSNIPEFNKVECWGPLRDAASTRRCHARVDAGEDAGTVDEEATNSNWKWPKRCQVECDCCFPLHNSTVPWPRDDSQKEIGQSAGQPQQ